MSIHQMLGGLTDVLLSIFGMPLALSHQEHLYISDILLGGFKHLDYFPFHIWDIWDNPSHWLIFFRGIETSNQYKWSLKIIYINWWIWSFDRFSKSRLIYKSVAKYHQFDDLKKNAFPLWWFFKQSLVIGGRCCKISSPGVLAVLGSFREWFSYPGLLGNMN